MDKFQNKFRIPSARLQNWDYGWSAAYFVTICTANRECYFGDIQDHKMILSDTGIIADILWSEIQKHFQNITLDAFVVMPNHVHGIIIIHDSNKEGDIITGHAPGNDNANNNDATVDDNHDRNENHDRNDNHVVETRHALSLPFASNNANNNDATVDNNHAGNENHAHNGNHDRNNNHAVETRHALSLQSQQSQQSQQSTPSGEPMIPPQTIGQKRFQNQGKNTLSAIIGGYKSAVTKHARRLGYNFVWQARFHDHIIRNNTEYQRIKNYIVKNPEMWHEDTLNIN